jgi:hypothetical protein
MNELQRELAQCLQYYGPMTAEQIIEKMNLRPREPIACAKIREELTNMSTPEKCEICEDGRVYPHPESHVSYACHRCAKAKAASIHFILRVSRGLYSCNRAIGGL